MLSQQRHALILNEVSEKKAVSIAQLAQDFKVSPMTIRRDLDYLADQGLLKRTHGGAILVAPTPTLPREDDPPFMQRDQLQQSVKQRIAWQAAQLIEPGEQLILDSGSTVAAMCPYLAAKAPLTIITYSLPVIQALLGQPLELICTGGNGDATTHALSGPLTAQVLESVRVDKAFLGATSVSLNDGFSNSNLANLTLQRILLRVARQCYLLVDSTKFTRAPFWLVAGLENLSGIITDSKLPTETLRQLEQAGLPVMRVEVD